MPGPWTDGPRELIQHAVDHLSLGGDFDRRIAMLNADNAVELIIKTYLGLPERTRGFKGPGQPVGRVGKDGRAIVLERHEIVHGIDAGLDTRRDEAGEQAAHIGTEIVVVEQRVFALTNDQFQGALRRVAVKRRPGTRKKSHRLSCHSDGPNISSRDHH